MSTKKKPRRSARISKKYTRRKFCPLPKYGTMVDVWEGCAMQTRSGNNAANLMIYNGKVRSMKQVNAWKSKKKRKKN